MAVGIPAEYLDSLRNLHSACGAAHDDALTAGEFAKLELNLGTLYSGLARTIAALADDGWSADPEAPGFVRRTDSAFAVPWNLLAGFPVGDLAGEIAALAGRIRSPGGQICLSGSGASVQAFAHLIGDLDFCEYTEAGFDGCVSVAEGHSAPPLAWQAMRASRPEPWARVPTDKTPLPPPPESWRAKIDYVGQVPQLGVLDVTNVILRPGADVAALDFSFPNQEAPLVGHSGPLRHLTDPAGVGSYLRFLEEQTVHYLRKREVKAIRRGHSLLAAVGLGASADRLAEDPDVRVLLRGQCLRDRAELAARLDVDERWSDPMLACLATIAECGLLDVPKTAALLGPWVTKRLEGWRFDTRLEAGLGLLATLLNDVGTHHER